MSSENTPITDEEEEERILHGDPTAIEPYVRRVRVTADDVIKTTELGDHTFYIDYKPPDEPQDHSDQYDALLYMLSSMVGKVGTVYSTHRTRTWTFNVDPGRVTVDPEIHEAAIKLSQTTPMSYHEAVDHLKKLLQLRAFHSGMTQKVKEYVETYHQPSGNYARNRAERRAQNRKQGKRGAWEAGLERQKKPTDGTHTFRGKYRKGQKYG